MFPLMPNTAHFKSQMDVTFLGGATNVVNANVHTFNAVGNAPEAPRDRTFIVAVAGKRASSAAGALTQLVLNGVQAESLHIFDPGRTQDVYFAVVRHTSLVGPVNVVATFDGTLNACVVCVWCVDGMFNPYPLEVVEQNVLLLPTAVTLQLETPVGGVSFFAAAMNGDVNRSITNTDTSYRVAGIVTGSTSQSYVFSLVDNSTSETVRTGPQTITIGAGRVAGISFAGPPEPPFSPVRLFSSGEQGVWFDPNDLSSMFQDAAGTIPAAIGQPVGLIQDKSGNGNHASQAAAAARPTLGRVPAGGAYNRLLNTENFGASNWTASPSATVTPSGDIAKVVPADGTFALFSACLNYTPLNYSVGPVALSAEFKSDGLRYAKIGTSNNAGYSTVAAFDLQTGQLTYAGTHPSTATNLRGLIYPAGDGYWRCVFLFDWVLGTSRLHIGGSLSAPPQSLWGTSVGDGISGVLVRRPQVTALAEDTPYQRVGASRYDVTEDGVQSLTYLEFDGVDDFLPMGGVQLGGKRWYLGVSYTEPPTDMVLLSNASGSNNPWVYAAHQGSASTILAAAGTAVSGVWHDNSPSTATTRNQLYLETQPASVVGVDFTATTAWQARYGVYPGGTLSVPLRTYSIILREGDLSADHRTELTIWQAHRAGKAL